MDAREEIKRWLAALVQLEAESESKQIETDIEMLMGVTLQLTTELTNRNAALAKQCRPRKATTTKASPQNGPQKQSEKQRSDDTQDDEKGTEGSSEELSHIQQGIQQGIEQGMQRGVEQGERLGEVNVLSRLLAKRFGSLNAEIEARLKSATLEQLEQWTENILDAATLEDVFKSH